jgi:WD40 repeat protein
MKRLCHMTTLLNILAFLCLTARLHGQEEVVLKGHTDWITSVAYARDGKTLVSTSLDGSLRLWAIPSGEELATMSSEVLSCVCFSPDGKLIAAGGIDESRMEGRVFLCDAGTLQLQRVLKGHTQSVSALSFSGDGKTLGTGGYDGHTIIWDVASGGKRLVLTGHDAGIKSVCFSPDSKMVLTAGSYDGTIKTWDLGTGKCRLTIRGALLGNEVRAAVMNPEGTRVIGAVNDRALGASSQVKIWDIATGRREALLGGQANHITGMCLSPDGKFLASASWVAAGVRGDQNELVIWDLEEEKPWGRHRWAATSPSLVTCLAFSPDGRFIAVGSRDKTIKVFGVLKNFERKAQ